MNRRPNAVAGSTVCLVVAFAANMATSHIAFRDVLSPFKTVLYIGLSIVVRFATYTLIGAWIQVVLTSRYRLVKPTSIWRKRLVLIAVLLAAALLIRAYQQGSIPSAPTLMATFAALCLGSRLVNLVSFWNLPIGAKLVRTFGFLCIASLVSYGFLLSLTSASPLDIHVARINPTEKARVASILNDRKRDAGGVESVSLTAEDANTLFAIASERFVQGSNAEVVIDGPIVNLRVSLRDTSSMLLGRYLNVESALEVFADSNDFQLNIHSCRIGVAKIPSFMLDFCRGLLMDEMQANAFIRNALNRIERLEVRDGCIAVEINSDLLREDLKSAVRGQLGETPATRRATNAYLSHLARFDAGRVSEEQRFAEMLRHVFSLAKQRSAANSAVHENRAALLAISVRFGHDRMRMLIGALEHPIQNTTDVTVMTLRGRADWAKHFCVSAGLTVLTNTAVSDGAGLLKEEIDSGGRGSGFSFSDLMADRAGTTFATLAVRDSETARWLQEALISGIAVGDIFPNADDLPEGLRSDQLAERYGGVGGVAYQRLTNEIERRLTTCRLLRG